MTGQPERPEEETWTIYVCSVCGAPIHSDTRRCPCGHNAQGLQPTHAGGYYARRIDLVPLAALRAERERLAEVVKERDDMAASSRHGWQVAEEQERLKQQAERERDEARAERDEARADLAVERGRSQDAGWGSGVRRTVSPVATIQHVIPERP